MSTPSGKQLVNERKIVQKRIDFYGEAELCQLFRTLNEMWLSGIAKDREASFFCRVLIFTGARIMEAMNIQLQHCHSTTIFLEWVKANSKGEQYCRTVGWFPEFQPFYEEYVADRRANNRFVNPYLFPCKQWKKDRLTPISERWAHYLWDETVARSGIRHLPSHMGGRKTAATWLAEVLSIPDLQDQMVHTDYRTTEHYYRGSIPDRRFHKPFPEWRKVALEPYPELHKKLIEELAKVKGISR